MRARFIRSIAAVFAVPIWIRKEQHSRLPNTHRSHSSDPLIKVKSGGANVPHRFFLVRPTANG
jgi:hypothetical protein